MRRLNKTLIALSFTAFYSTSFAAINDTELDEATARAKRSPEEIQQEFHDYINRTFDQYEAWREEYTRDLDKQRQSLIDQWGSAELSDPTTDVQYSDNDTVRQVVDYENNTATVSVLVDASVSDQQAKQLAASQARLPEGSDADLSQAEVSLNVVDYSPQQEKREKAFVLAQLNAQMNEYDIQAERLIAADTGVPDDFIYQRAHDKKMKLVEETKQRLQSIVTQYKAKRQELGIPEPEPEQAEIAEATTETTPAASVADPKPAQADTAHVSAPVKADAEPARTPANVALSEKTDTARNHAQTQPAAKPSSAAKPTVAAKKIISYKISLPNNSLAKRASQYQPLALEESKKWSVDPALVMAIMHSESSFRPDAKSFVPAFGLMQVVPTTAGHDVNRRVRNIDAPMKEAELYQPTVNVETGTAYLHILDSNYLKNIENEQSRLYCTIAAYNTGAGNVARAFNADRSTNIRKAATEINQLTPDQVYQQLMTKLPYDETKTYLKKVSSRLALYQPETTQ